MTSFSGSSQGFDPNDQSIYYTIPGPAVVQAQLIAGVFQDINTFPLTRFNNTGQVNGLGCNPIDSCLYYINNSGGTCHLYRLDAAGTCTLISSTMINYAVNGGVDLCGNYIQYQSSQFIKTNIATGIVTNYPAPNLGFITDIDYNPYTCEYLNVFYNPGDMLITDTLGALLQTFTSPQSGTTNVGGGSYSPDGTEIYLSRAGNIYAYDITTGVHNATIPLNVAAAGAPIADMATFQYDDVVADISSNVPNDTLYFITCDDSIDVTFNNLSTGNLNEMLWDFGDGTNDITLTPTHRFETNNTYEVVFMAERFSCETCQTDADNYDTLYIVIDPDVLQTTVTGTDPVCIAANDGMADVTNIVGGTAPYSYLWTGSGNTNATENGLGAGWVYVEVTGTNGCFNLDSVLLSNPAAVEINLATTDAICFQSNDGTAIAAPINPPTTYSYTWSSSANTTANEMNIPAGPQSVIVTNLAGCDTTYLFNINEPTEVTVSPLLDTTICLGGTAFLDAVAAGGSGGHTVNWVGLGVGMQNVNPIVNTCYDVQSTDINGCVSSIEQICVNLHTALNVSVAGSDICPGDLSQLTSNSAGGFGPYAFSWDVNAVQVGTNPDLSMAQLTTTNYCLTLSDGCETPAVTDCITIDVFSEPQLMMAPQMICEGENVLFPEPAVNPAEVISYSWQFGDGGSSTSSSTSNTYDFAGDYSVTIDIVSADNCNFQSIFTDIITVTAIPDVSFQLNPHVVTIEDTEVDFYNGTTDATNFIWEFGDNSNSTELDPSHIYPQIAGSSYTVTLHAYNGVCHDSAQQVVHVEDIIIYYIPNAFTPDGNGYNEEFKPVITSGIDIYEYHLMIFNRWGEIVFESYNPANGWNGHYGNGGLAEDGTYIWSLEFGETMSDKQYKDHGHVTVLK